MPPYQNQNGYQAPPPDPNRYDFFLDPAKPPKKSLIPKGNSKAINFLLICLGVVVLFMIVVVVASVLSGRSDNPQLTKVLLDQHEITRVAELGAKQVESQSLKNFSANAIATSTSARQQLTTYLGQQGIELNEKQLIAAQDPRIDEALTAALSSSTYDTTFRSTMQGLLTEYQTNIKAAQASSTSDTENSLLTTYLSGAELLEIQLEP